MSRSDDERVADILEAADELAMVVAVGRGAFGDSVLHRRAAERLLEIIGEASTSLTDDFKASHPDVAWRDVSALRILLAHHYHRVDLDQVWQIRRHRYRTSRADYAPSCDLGRERRRRRGR